MTNFDKEIEFNDFNKDCVIKFNFLYMKPEIKYCLDTEDNRFY